MYLILKKRKNTKLYNSLYLSYAKTLNLSINCKKEENCFWNQTFDKGRLKTFVLWFLKNQGEHKTIKLVEELKNIGFQYATKAGISLGLEDLKIPKKKYSLIMEAEQLSSSTIKQHKKGDITSVERFQRLIDTWHRTSERLKQEVIDNFEGTDILNPVYMMAFSGARGNISQVRQLVGMRGLMSNPQGQIIDFPIRSNFREGLTLTEYIISSYGARKGIVDTALRTANAGYLTRRLVDVAQHVIISSFDCGTKRGIFLNDMKDGNKIIYSLQNRLIGRVLARDVYDTQTIKIGSRNIEISPELAITIAQHNKKVFVRSSLTCQTKKLVCQLCYGWSLAQGNLVSIGEAVGVIAAQSIGEPGTQLTMRTFHTGGVFSGDISDQIRAPFDGIVEYVNPIAGTLVRTPEGKIAFLTKNEGSLMVHSLKQLKLDYQTQHFEQYKDLFYNKQNINPLDTKRYKIPFYTLLYLKNGEKVGEKEVIGQISSINRQKNMTDQAELTIHSELSGQLYSKILDLKETKVGPKLKNPINGSDMSVEQFNENAVDIIFESWGWGYAWVLSGKIYQLSLPSSIFPIFGDYVNQKTFTNQITWTIPSSFGTAFKLNMPFNKKLFNRSVIKQLRQNEIHLINTEEQSQSCRNSSLNPSGFASSMLKLNNEEVTLLKNDLISFQLSKIFYKKIGYLLKLMEPSSFSFTKHKLNSNQIDSFISVNDSLFLYSSLFSKKSLNYQNNFLYPSKWGPSFNILLNWFPKSLSTKTGGLFFMEPIQFSSIDKIKKNTKKSTSINKKLNFSFNSAKPKQSLHLKGTPYKQIKNKLTFFDKKLKNLFYVFSNKSQNKNVSVDRTIKFFPTFLKRDVLKKKLKGSFFNTRLGFNKETDSRKKELNSNKINNNLILEDVVKQTFKSIINTQLTSDFNKKQIIPSNGNIGFLSKKFVYEQYQKKHFGTIIQTGGSQNKNKTKKELLNFGLHWKNSFKLNFNDVSLSKNSNKSKYIGHLSLNRKKLKHFGRILWIDQPFYNISLKNKDKTFLYKNNIFISKDFVSNQNQRKTSFLNYKLPIHVNNEANFDLSTIAEVLKEPKKIYSDFKTQPFLIQLNRQGLIKPFIFNEGYLQSNLNSSLNLSLSSINHLDKDNITSNESFIEFYRNPLFKYKQGTYCFTNWNTDFKNLINLIKTKKRVNSFLSPYKIEEFVKGSILKNQLNFKNHQVYKSINIKHNLKTFSKMNSFPYFLNKKRIKFIKKELVKNNKKAFSYKINGKKLTKKVNKKAKQIKLIKYYKSAHISKIKNNLKPNKTSLFNYYCFSLFNKNYKFYSTVESLGSAFNNFKKKALTLKEIFKFKFFKNRLICLQKKNIKLTLKSIQFLKSELSCLITTSLDFFNKKKSNSNFLIKFTKAIFKKIKYTNVKQLCSLYLKDQLNYNFKNLYKTKGAIALPDFNKSTFKIILRYKQDQYLLKGFNLQQLKDGTALLKNVKDVCEQTKNELINVHNFYTFDSAFLALKRKRKLYHWFIKSKYYRKSKLKKLIKINKRFYASLFKTNKLNKKVLNSLLKQTYFGTKSMTVLKQNKLVKKFKINKKKNKKLNICRKLINFTMKSGWLYYTSDLSNIILYNKKLINPGKSIGFDLIFDNNSVYVEIISLDKMSINKSNFYNLNLKSLNDLNNSNFSNFKYVIKNEKCRFELNDKIKSPFNRNLNFNKKTMFSNEFLILIRKAREFKLHNNFEMKKEIYHLANQKNNAPSLYKVNNINSTKTKNQSNNLKIWVNKIYNSMSLNLQYKTELLNKQKITSQILSKYPSSDFKVLSNTEFYLSLFSLKYSYLNTSFENQPLILPAKGHSAELGLLKFYLKLNKLNAWTCLPITSLKPINFSPLIISYNVPYSLDYPFKKPLWFFSEQTNSNLFYNKLKNKKPLFYNKKVGKLYKYNLSKKYDGTKFKNLIENYLLKKDCFNEKQRSLPLKNNLFNFNKNQKNISTNEFCNAINSISSLFACPIFEYSLGQNIEKSISYPNNLLVMQQLNFGTWNLNNTKNKRILLGKNGPILGSLNGENFNGNKYKINKEIGLYKTEVISFIDKSVRSNYSFLNTYSFCSFEGELIYLKQLNQKPIKNSSENNFKDGVKRISNKEKLRQTSLKKSVYFKAKKQKQDSIILRGLKTNVNSKLPSDFESGTNEQIQTESCMILTKNDQIAYYLSNPNFKDNYNALEKLKKKNQYMINDMIIHFINIIDPNNKEPELQPTSLTLFNAGDAKVLKSEGESLSQSLPGEHLVEKPKELNFIMNKEPNLDNNIEYLIKLNNLPAGLSNQKSNPLIGDFLVYGDQISPNVAISKTGQIIHLNNQKVTIRKGQPIFISPKAILHKYDGDFIQEKIPVITLSYQQLKTGDIIQGIPKVEQFFEARTTKRGRLFRDSLANLLNGLFKRYSSKLPQDQAVRQSFYKIQQIIVDGVQRVYRSQGVTIADKHLEIIVKQMTSKVRIVEGGQTGFFPGEVVDLDFVEQVNELLMKKILYEPLVLGITKSSLEVESFLSAASFQQTTRVLSKAAISRKKDFLKGLKENVILGNLIPAGTGYLVYLDQI